MQECLQISHFRRLGIYRLQERMRREAHQLFVNGISRQQQQQKQQLWHHHESFKMINLLNSNEASFNHSFH